MYTLAGSKNEKKQPYWDVLFGTIFWGDMKVWPFAKFVQKFNKFNPHMAHANAEITQLDWWDLSQSYLMLFLDE